MPQLRPTTEADHQRNFFALFSLLFTSFALSEGIVHWHSDHIVGSVVFFSITLATILAIALWRGKYLSTLAGLVWILLCIFLCYVLLIYSDLFVKGVMLWLGLAMVMSIITLPVSYGLAFSFAYLLAFLAALIFDIPSPLLDRYTENDIIHQILVIIGAASMASVYNILFKNHTTRIESAEQQAKAAVAELEKTQRYKDQLFAIIGHELRTPAAAIKMLHDRQGVASLKPHGQAIVDSTEHLLSILDDMRAVVHPEQVATGKVASISIVELVEKSLDFLTRLLQERRLRVHLESNVLSHDLYQVNVRLLRQIVLNLVKNAAIHSEASDLWINIQARETGETRRFLELRFADNGKGIASSDQEKLFDAFARGDTVAEGTGLGLHIARQYAREHLHGDLYYQDRQQGGAEFVLTLDLEQAAVSETATENLPQILAGLRILLAEDTEVIREATVSLLAANGAIVQSASNGKEALELALRNEFDAVITDIFMPEMDGYALTRELRLSGFNLPIIAVTAALVGDESEKMLLYGASAVIAKPIDLHRLNSSIAEAML